MELYGIDAFENGDFSKQQLNFSSMLHRQIIYWCMGTANLHIIKSGTIRLKNNRYVPSLNSLDLCLRLEQDQRDFEEEWCDTSLCILHVFYLFFGIVNTPLSQHDCTKVQVKIGNFWWPKIGSTHLMLPAIWCWEGSMFEMQVMPGPFICPMKEAQEIIWLRGLFPYWRIHFTRWIVLRDSMKKTFGSLFKNAILHFVIRYVC